jgi:hypothetical protein
MVVRDSLNDFPCGYEGPKRIPAIKGNPGENVFQMCW